MAIDGGSPHMLMRHYDNICYFQMMKSMSYISIKLHSQIFYFDSWQHLYTDRLKDNNRVLQAVCMAIFPPYPNKHDGFIHPCLFLNCDDVACGGVQLEWLFPLGDNHALHWQHLPYCSTSEHVSNVRLLQTGSLNFH